MMSMRVSSEPVLKQLVDRDGKKTVEVYIPDQKISQTIPYSLTIKHQRVILYQGNQKDAWGHSNGTITTAIKQYTLAKEDIVLSNSTLANHQTTSLSTPGLQNDSFSVRILPFKDGISKATISLNDQLEPNSSKPAIDHIQFHSLHNSISKIGCTDSIHVRIAKNATENSINGSKLSKAISSTLGVCKFYLSDRPKGSSITLEKRTFRKDLLTKTWKEKGKGIIYPVQTRSGTFNPNQSHNDQQEEEEEDEYEEYYLPTLLDSPPPYER